jgi:hypothetical protein
MSSDSNRHKNEEKIEAGPIKQAILGLVDVVLSISLVVLLLKYQKPWPLYQLLSSINPVLLLLIGLIFYRLVCFTLFNGTIGMKLLGVVILNGEQQPLTLKEKLLASFFILYQGVDYYNR